MYECIRGGDRYVYGGIGDGEVHRDPGVVVGDLVGVVGGGCPGLMGGVLARPRARGPGGCGRGCR